jgi:hypothetical protein
MMTFHHLEKFSFSIRIHLLGVVIAALIVQHRLFTASVSHGGHFFQLLPAFCGRYLFETKNVRFLSPGFIFGWLFRRYSRAGFRIKKWVFFAFCMALA